MWGKPADDELGARRRCMIGEGAAVMNLTVGQETGATFSE